MLKTKLPVIVLRNMILLPHGELKLEISNKEDKTIIYKAINNHQGYVLLISPEYITEEIIKLEDLPKIGIIGKITSNFELPNDNMRLSITGINRANVFEYMEQSKNDLNAIIGPIDIVELDNDTAEAMLRRLKKEFSSYISSMPNISNGLISKISYEESLEKLTDIIVNILPLKFEEKVKYIFEIDPILRSSFLLKCLNNEIRINTIDKDIDKELKKELDKTNREYVLREKLKVIKEELGDVNDKDAEIEELTKKIEKLKANTKIKNKLLKELKKYEYIPSVSPEVSNIKGYIDILLELPFGVYTKDERDLNKIEEELNKSHYSLNDVKERIIEYIAVKELNKENISPILCLVGPPGVGKTSFAYSVAKALKRKFVKISVGGVSDEAEIIGHRRTYIGSEPGRIINGIKKAGSMNPVFLIDEIDKMTKDIKGDPASALLEVLDREQNNTFCDNYIEEEFDLSKVMFILTANNIEDIPYALKDRLEIITLTSYTVFEKIDIVKNYLFNKLLINNGIKNENIQIDDETIKYIIEHYTKEAGIRELERVFSKIMRKIARKIIAGNGNNFIVNINNLKEYLGKEKYEHLEKGNNKESGIVNGLAYTELGGEILPIETTLYKGKGNLIITGLLGDVMSESVKIALGYVKYNFEKLKIDIEKIDENDIHINALNGAIPKNGPSAGTAITTSIISKLLDKKVSDDIAMTGEMTLSGDILPIGGLREKTIGAYNAGIKKIYIPKGNEKDIDDIPEHVKEEIKIKLVSNYIEIYKEIFK